MLDFNEVAMFVQVVQAGSFAEAGRQLGMAPNTLSRRVLQVEEQLGVRLLQRTTRKLALTTAGRQFFDRCSGAVEAIGSAGRELLDGSEVPTGSIRVAAPADFFGLFRIEWIAEFLTAYGRVNLEFELDDVRADMVSESIDVALRAGQLPNSTLIARKISESYSILVASPTYLAARGMPESVGALPAHDCVAIPHPSGRQKWVLRGPEGVEEVEVTGRFSANTAQALLEGALAGLGVALLPALRVIPDLKAKRLVHVLHRYRRDGGGFYAVFPSRRQMPLAASAFADFVSEKMHRLQTAVEVGDWSEGAVMPPAPKPT